MKTTRPCVPGCREHARASRLRSFALPGLIAALLATTSAAPPAAAQIPGAAEPPGEAAADPAAESRWSFLFNLYGWIPEMQGTVKTDDVTADIDIGFDQVFDLLGDGKALAGAGHFEVVYDRKYSFFLDAFGGTARPSSHVTLGRREVSATADLTMNYTFFEFGGAYRVFDYHEGDSRPILVDVLAGGRLMYFYEAVCLEGQGPLGIQRSTNISTTWVDPFVGGRFVVPVFDDFGILFRADIGGFDVGSKLAWNVLSGLTYRLPWRPFGTTTSIVVAYKAIDFDQTSDNGNVVIDLNMRGPAVGMAFAF